MIRVALLGLFAFVLSLAVYLYFYLGFYKPVDVALERRGPLYFLYKTHTGAYHQIGPAISAVENWTHEHKVPCEKTFGEYLDDPQAVDQDRLRSRGGCVLSGPLNSPPAEFQYEQRPEREYVVARFSGSPAIGPFKVYPKAKQFISEKRLKSAEGAIEVYLVRGDKVETEYLFPIEVAQ